MVFKASNTTSQACDKKPVHGVVFYIFNKLLDVWNHLSNCFEHGWNGIALPLWPNSLTIGCTKMTTGISCSSTTVFAIQIAAKNKHLTTSQFSNGFC